MKSRLIHQLSGSIFVVALLLLRMVPDSFSRPFILARTQPLLSDESRATYLSIKSLAGRLFFAATLWVASTKASDVGAMPHSEIRTILSAYAAFGCVALIALALAARGRGI